MTPSHEITFKVRLGIVERMLAAPIDTRLLDRLLAEGDLLPGVCGGGLTCGACHVALTPEPGEIASALEHELLDLADRPRVHDSRLACQVTLGPQHAGAVVAILGGATSIG